MSVRMVLVMLAVIGAVTSCGTEPTPKSNVRLEWTLPAAASPPDSSVAFTTDGRRLLRTAADSIEVIDVQTRQRVATLHDCRSRPCTEETGGYDRPIAISPDGRMLAAPINLFQSEHYAVDVWNLAGQRLVTSIPGKAWTVAFTADGQRLLTLDDSDEPSPYTVTVRNLHDGGSVTRRFQIGQPAYSMAVSPDGKFVAIQGISDDQPHVEVWDVEGERKLATPDYRQPQALTFSPDNRILAIGTMDGSVELLDIHLNALAGRLTTPATKLKLTAIAAQAFSADGQTFVAVNSDGKLLLWDVPSRRFLTAVDCHPSDSISLSHDGTLVAVAGGSQRTQIFTIK